MNAALKIKDIVNYNFSTHSFAPDLAAAQSEQFPLHEITAHIGIADPDALNTDDIQSNRLQSLNFAFGQLVAYTFDGMDNIDEKRRALSLDFDLQPSKVVLDGLKVTSSNGEQYFCGNMKAIRQAVESMSGVIEEDAEAFATALQKALVSHALKTNKPVMFVYYLIEENDKMVLSKSDRYLQRNSNAKPVIEANALAHEG